MQVKCKSHVNTEFDQLEKTLKLLLRELSFKEQMCRCVYFHFKTIEATLFFLFAFSTSIV